MKNKRTQYTKYHEKMKKLMEECNMGGFSFVEDSIFDKYGKYFLKTVNKYGPFKLYRYIDLYYYDEKTKDFEWSLDLENLYLTRNCLQNDIFEGLPYSDDYDLYSQDECVQKLTNLAYLKCFTEDYKNNLMWAHYANSYKGICIEYDISRLEDKKIAKQIFPVYYTKERIMFASIEALIEFVDEKQENQALRDAKGIFLSKSKSWKYEKEWRICQMNHEYCAEKTKKIPFDCISAIYMGMRIDNNDIDKIFETLNCYNEKHNKKEDDKIKVYKMKMPTDNSYDLTCEEYTK